MRTFWVVGMYSASLSVRSSSSQLFSNASTDPEAICLERLHLVDYLCNESAGGEVHYTHVLGRGKVLDHTRLLGFSEPLGYQGTGSEVAVPALLCPCVSNLGEECQPCGSSLGAHSLSFMAVAPLVQLPDDARNEYGID